MKHIKVGLFFTCLFISINIKAQQNHFIYIQADNKQPFYVKLDKKVYSSTVSGYLVVSKLKTGVYNFVIGFPKNEWTEQNIRCAVDDKDLGYLLKNFGDKGWGFFNLQSLNVLMADNNEKKVDVVTDVKSDAFSNMLSSVVNDPTIKQKEPPKEEIKKAVKEEVKIEPLLISAPVQSKVLEKPKTQSSVSPLPEKDKLEEAQKLSPAIVAASTQNKVSEISKTDSPVVSAHIKNEVAELPKVAPAINRSTIIKKIINKTTDGIEMVYIDTANAILDTIRVFIAVDKDVVDNSQVKIETDIKPKEEIKVKEIEAVPIQAEVKKKDNKFIEVELTNPNKKITEVKPDAIVQQVISKTVMINSDCKNFATNEDFLKLRKKMAGEENPEDMIMAAKKAFKSRCFTTEQLKNLSVLFLKDSGRYSFFDVAYPFVSDSQNYSLLEGQLSETYYINRFRVMIKH